MTPSVLVDQIDSLRKTDPEAPLVVFVPRTQLGTALENALARRRSGWQGIRTLIPRHYAEEIARIDAIQSGRQEAPVEGQFFRAARILQRLPEEEQGADLPGWHLLAATVSDAIDTLRKGDVEVQPVKERAAETDSPDTLRIVANCYERYVQELGEDHLYDDGTVYEWATERVHAGGASGVNESIYAVVGAADLPEHAFRFLEALRAEAKDFARLGVESISDPPPESAAARFQEVGIPGGDSDEKNTSTVPSPERSGEEQNRFMRAVGARNEVRAVLRDLLEQEVSFGNAMIAYASPRPYEALIPDLADRADIPVTIGTGRQAHQTRTGRSLRDLYEWVLEDYDPAILIRMLRGGLLRTDRWLPDQGEESDEMPTLHPHRAASLLAERSYEAGRQGIVDGLQSAISELKGNLKKYPDSPPPRREKRLRQFRLLKDLTGDLAELIPRDGDVREMAQNGCRFLEVFGPVDAPGAEEGERSLNEAARALLYQRLERLGQLDVTCRAPARRLAALFQRWLGEQYVQAEAPRPGRVHVLPLESAGYSDRSHLYVVGLDSTTFTAPFPENGMLRDTDRHALMESLEQEGGGKSRSSAPRSSRTRAEEALWRADRALRRHQGPISYYTRVFDVEAGEKRDPSSVFLQRERRLASESETETGKGDAPERKPNVAGLVPQKGSVPLSEGDQWLSAYRDGRPGASSIGPEDVETGASGSARDVLGKRYPWILRGEAAHRARRSERYTAHDGLLPEGPYPELGIFGREGDLLSASRLETLAEAPYIYFLKYVLGARPLDEPALDDEAWLNPRRKGSLLHRIYNEFMEGLDRRPPRPEDEPRLQEVVGDVLESETEQFPPPSPVAEASAQRELQQNARLFLRAEIERGDEYVPERFELGFGFPPQRRQQGDYGEPARLEVGGKTLSLRGRIDRIDRRRGRDTLAIWDYKTGSASSHDEEEPLRDGRTLQWALYAYGLEQLMGKTVEESGYFFANTKEIGTRIAARPDCYRTEVERLLERFGALAESGSFPETPEMREVSDWRWGGYDRLVHDLRDRGKELKGKKYPEGRPEPPSF